MRSFIPTAVLSASLALAQDPQTITILALLGGNYEASVIAVSQQTTTLELVCPSSLADPNNSSRDGSDCGFADTLTATVASTFLGASVTDGGATGSVACTYTVTDAAFCSQVYTSMEAGATPESYIGTLSDDQYPGMAPVTITAGLEKLGGAESAAASTETGARSTASGSRTSAPASAPASTGAAATGFARAGSVAGALGAVAVAAFAL